jgi:hypothetical protein
MPKQCLKCELEKGLDQFSKDRTRKDGLSPYCKECRKEPAEVRRVINKAFYAANKEQQKQRRRDYYQANRTSCLVYAKTHRQRPEIKAALQAYYRGPGLLKSRGHVRKRRGLRKQIGEVFTPMMELAVRRAFGDRCFVTGETETDHKRRTGYSLNLDHVEPLIRGVPLTFDNCCLLSQEVNRSKNKSGMEFFRRSQRVRLRELQEAARKLHETMLLASPAKPSTVP